jgi:membrane protease YdiL (CAAX protease family)
VKEFLLFLKSGNTGDEKKYLIDFVLLFTIIFAIGITISFLKGYFYNIPMIENDSFEMLNWKTFFSYVIVVPLIEEIIFRGPLLIPRTKIYSILLSSVIIITSFIYLENENLSITITVIIVAFQTLYLLNETIKKSVNRLIDENYLLLVIITSLAFGLLHLSNYELLDFQSLISVIGRIIAGFYFAFIVTKYNFRSSYFLHGINNIIPFVILLVAK